MKCPRCEHENPPQAKFCLECATPLARQCANCAADAVPLNRVEQPDPQPKGAGRSLVSSDGEDVVPAFRLAVAEVFGPWTRRNPSGRRFFARLDGASFAIMATLFAVMPGSLTGDRGPPSGG